MKICLECKYERTIQDNLLYPDYECPSCGIIFEKDKAKKALAELEEQREQERKAKREKLKKEEARQKKAEEDRQRQGEEALKQKEEEARINREEEERLRQEEKERQKKAEEERQRQAVDARKQKEEEARFLREKEDRLRKEQKEKLRKLEEERERKREEEKNRKAEQEKRRKEEEAKRIIQKRQEKISALARESADKVITSEENVSEYQLFDMCPFAIAQTGKGLAIAGIGDKKNKWQHMRCIQKYCRLWTLKIDDNGEVYAQGCAMQFQDLSKEEIAKNFTVKNTRILEEAHPLESESKDNETQK
ncbi:MAG: hypothetical protein GQ556_06635 [Desulfobacterales bacterium]|nr:hypothetical protein [Desulfobacterales bacterium]